MTARADSGGVASKLRARTALTAARARLGRAPALAEAAIFLLCARVLLVIAPIDRLLSGERSPGDQRPLTCPPSAPSAILVASALRGAARRLPWKSNCLVRALAGRWMLHRRRLESVVHLGMQREATGLTAHAWLEAGGGIVCGGEGVEDFKPIARIRSPGAPH